MPLPLRAGIRLLLLSVAGVCSWMVEAQSAYLPQETEYPVAGSLPGDQMFPAVSLNNSGGYIVWQDNLTDGDGFGISARRLNSSLSGEFGAFRINELGASDQEKPKVAMLNDGGAVFVWQSGPPGFQDIYARLLSAGGIFITGDILVNTTTNDNQINPDVTVLANGNVVVVWTSYSQGSLGTYKDVLAQQLSPAGQKVGGEFRLSRYLSTPWQTQRTPAVAALANGNFAAVWVSDYVSSNTASNFYSTNGITAGAQIYCRVFQPSGTSLNASDVPVSAGSSPYCANPAIAGLPGGGFTVVWNQRDVLQPTNSWDIVARSFNASAAPNAPPVPVNTFTYGDQYAPRIASLGSDQLVVWTSLGQDGSQEGVFGRWLANGAPSGDELRVNTTVISKQMLPALASDQTNRFLVVWTSFVGGGNGFDLYAQRYAGNAVMNNAPGAPFVSRLSSSQLEVAWPELAGYFDLAWYELYMDSVPTPIILLNNYYVAAGLAPSSAHSFRLAYRFTDGSMSLLSSPGTNTTWGPDNNFNGLPDNWEARYWGPNPANWPSPNEDSDHDGVNNLQEFLAGTDPTDPNSVFRMKLIVTSAGGTLSWTTQPGSIYQVQSTVDFVDWTSFGSSRFAAGTNDSIIVGGLQDTSYYRVIRMR